MDAWRIAGSGNPRTAAGRRPTSPPRTAARPALPRSAAASLRGTRQRSGGRGRAVRRISATTPVCHKNQATRSMCQTEDYCAILGQPHSRSRRSLNGSAICGLVAGEPLASQGGGGTQTPASRTCPRISSPRPLPGARGLAALRLVGSPPPRLPGLYTCNDCRHGGATICYPLTRPSVRQARSPSMDGRRGLCVPGGVTKEPVESTAATESVRGQAGARGNRTPRRPGWRGRVLRMSGSRPYARANVWVRRVEPE
jgi:hypothetical protein